MMAIFSLSWMLSATMKYAMEIPFKKYRLSYWASSRNVMIGHDTEIRGIEDNMRNDHIGHDYIIGRDAIVRRDTIVGHY